MCLGLIRAAAVRVLRPVAATRLLTGTNPRTKSKPRAGNRRAGRQRLPVLNVNVAFDINSYSRTQGINQTNKPNR